MVKTPQGTFSARRYYYKIYHPDWDNKGKVIHLNNNDLDFSPDNLVLLTERECNNLVHFNNPFLTSTTTTANKEQQELALSLVRLRIILKEVMKDEGRY